MNKGKSKGVREDDHGYIDSLTSVFTRKFFSEHLKQALIETMEFGHHFTLALVDIDDFAHYNEMNGADRGNQVLQQVGYLLNRNLRNEDFVIRYDGDEFLLVLTATPKMEAFHVAERLRKTIETYHFSGEEIQPNGNLTVSLGMASFPEDGDSIDFLIKRADTALYQAKQRMKNRVEVFE